MRKFIVNLIIFSLILFVLDVLVGFYLKALPGLEVDNRLERVIEGQINSDVIILGSSIGARGVLAEQIEDQSNLSAFNLAYPGSNIEFHEFILSTYLSVNKTPKTVVLTIDETIFKTDKSLKFRLDKCYPLIKYKRIKDAIIKKEDKNRFFGNYSNLYMINKSNLSFKKKKYIGYDSINSRGSMPLTFQKKSFKAAYNENSKLYSYNGELNEKLNLFKNIIELCKANKIDLVLSIPPKYSVLNTSFVNRIRKLYKGPFVFVQENDVTFKAPALFSDAIHLNKKGAQLYTNYIINYLNTGE